MRAASPGGQAGPRSVRPLALVVLLALALACGTPPCVAATAAQTPAATPIALTATADERESAGDETPLPWRIPAWQVVGGVLLGALVATLVLYVVVRFGEQASA